MLKSYLLICFKFNLSKWLFCFILAHSGFAWSQEPPENFPPQMVRVDPARAESLQNHHFVTGELRAVRRSRVAAQEAGQVKEFVLKEGQIVKSGDTLARLDSQRLEIQKLEAQADLQVVLAGIEETKAQLELHEWQYQTFQKLTERGSSHESELREAKSAMAVSQARIIQADKQIEVIQAQMNLLDRRLADSTITAPFDAAVVKLYTELGEWLNPGDAVAEIVSVGTIDAWLEIPESLSASLPTENLAVEIQVEAIKESFKLTAPRIIQDINPQTRTFSLIVTLDNQQARLKHGMSITGWVPTGKKADYLTVSNDAIIRGETGAYVFMIQKGPNDPVARALPIPVTLLFHTTDRVAIDAMGIKAGDLFVVEGNERLVPNMPVRFNADEIKKPDTPLDNSETASKEAG